MMHGGSWYNLDQLCSSSMQDWAVKDDLRAKNLSFGRLRQSRRFGLEPDLSSIDTHLQFLCIPHSHSSTPQKCELCSRVCSLLFTNLEPSIPFPHSLFLYCFPLLIICLSCAYLCTLLSDLILTNTVRSMVWKASVAWLCFLSGTARGMFLLSWYG